jgi:branched-chain amino acid transport system ATP-binding protein
LLVLENVSSGYEHIEVVHQVSLNVKEGEIACIIGANGAGKTTLMSTISRLIQCRPGGRIEFDGEDISLWSPERVVAAGLVQVPEGRQVFSPLTVYENLLLGTYSTRTKLTTKRRQELFDFVYDIYPVLKARGSQRAGTLSGGEQQALAIGRALMSEPRLMLMDEPSLGLAPKLISQTYDVLKKLNEAGMTILLVEQKAHLALRFSDRAYVMETGRMTLEGSTAEIRNSPKVVEAYLG